VDRKRGERYKQKFCCQTVERMNACENIQRLSRELGIHARLLYKWRDQELPSRECRAVIKAQYQLRWKAEKCGRKVNKEGESNSSDHRNLLISFGSRQLRKALIKLVSWLLTEKLVSPDLLFIGRLRSAK
jgi:transposase-like protein